MFRRLEAALFVITFFVLSALAGAGHAVARDRTLLIGKGKLEASGSSATIDVSAAAGAFKAIRVEASKGPIQFTGVRIVYADDTFHLIEKRFQLKTGEQTKPLDPLPAGRFINSVVLSYIGGSEATEVEIHGIQDRTGARKARPKSAVATAKPVESPATQSPSSSAVVPPQASPPSPLADPASIADGRDIMFGYQGIESGLGNATIAIGEGTGKFHALRLRVLDANLEINAIEIAYTDGTGQVIGVDSLIKAGQTTKWYKADDKKFIRELRLTYVMKPGTKSARVEVLGQYADGWLAASGEGRTYNDGWVLLGSETAGSIGFDKDVVSVGKNEGGFKRIRLKVRDRSITLREIRVVYQDGSFDAIKANDRVDPDQIAGPWNLKSSDTAVKEIVATYRRRMLFGTGKGKAVVEFWGQH